MSESVANPNRIVLTDYVKLMSEAESAQQTSEEAEPTYALKGLTARDIDRLSLALYILTEDTVPGSDEWFALTALSDRLYRVDTD